MTDEVKFCYKCGASLPDGADFCPECGASLRADGENVVPERTVRTAPTRQDSLGAIPVLILVYGIFALIIAFFAFMSGIMLDTMLDMLKDYAERGLISQDDYNQFLELIGATTEAGKTALKTNLIIEGIIFALSGIAAIVSSHFCGKLENYQMAFYMCIAASALTLVIVFIGDISGLLLAVVGFVMCYLIYQNKYKFTS
ncbi:MAG: zinc-ribbon domain-containing protein [Candidatus Methanomethylophilaceae archaeon]|nr:zinc-ribbon domain-containing protein [Candidatus Methanomethylophilaceae archaeon]